MSEVIVGKKRDDLVYVPVECRIRMLVTADFFESGGEIANEEEFCNTIQHEVVERLRGIRDETYPVVQGELRVGTVCVGPIEPGVAK